jgi:hypothetical protein
MSAAIRRRRDELVRRVGRFSSAADVFAQTSSRLRQVVPFDGATWVAHDPGTGFPTAPVQVDDLHEISAALCADYCRREFLDDDVNLFGDLTRAPVPAASLLSATADPELVAKRFTEFHEPIHNAAG